MSTQFMTIDGASFISFPGPGAAEPTRDGKAPATNLLADSEFFRGKSINELACEQGVGPIKDIRVFAGGIPDDEDVDELLAQLEAMRGS